MSSAAALNGKPQFRLQPLLVNRQYDLALLRIQAGSATAKAPSFPALELGNSQSVNLLDDLIIIGYPEKGGSSVTLSTGVVEGRDILGNWIKTDARAVLHELGIHHATIELEWANEPCELEHH